MKVYAEYNGQILREATGLNINGKTYSAERILEMEGHLKNIDYLTHDTIRNLSTEIIDKSIKNCSELHDYAGRPKWDQAINDAIISVLELKR